MSCAPSSIQWYMDQSDGTSGFGGTSGSLFLRRHHGSPDGVLLFLSRLPKAGNRLFFHDISKTGSDIGEYPGG